MRTATAAAAAAAASTSSTTTHELADTKRGFTLGFGETLAAVGAILAAYSGVIFAFCHHLHLV